jgi:hypothetical protein
MRLGSNVAAAAMLALVAQPCLAAENYREAPVRMGAPGGFAGVRLHWSVGEGVRAKPTARLQMTTTQRLHNPVTGEISTTRASGFELGLARAGKPALYFGGHDQAEVNRKLGLSGGTTALIIGGVVIGLVVIALAAGGAGPGDTCPEVNGSRDHCINP